MCWFCHKVHIPPPIILFLEAVWYITNPFSNCLPWPKWTIDLDGRLGSGIMDAPFHWADTGPIRHVYYIRTAKMYQHMAQWAFEYKMSNLIAVVLSCRRLLGPHQWNHFWITTYVPQIDVWLAKTVVYLGASRQWGNGIHTKVLMHCPPMSLFGWIREPH